MTTNQVGAVMQQPIWSVGPDDTLESIGREFVARQLRWAPVLNEADALIAVVSAWDLIRFQVEGHPPQTPAWQACTYRPECASPETPLAEAARMMREQDIHHLPVVSGDKVVGVVSSLDLLVNVA